MLKKLVLNLKREVNEKNDKMNQNDNLSNEKCDINEIKDTNKLIEIQLYEAANNIASIELQDENEQ